MFFLLFFSAFVNANSITCSSYSSMARVYTENGRVFLRLDDAIGHRNFPLYDGIVTPMQIPMIQRAEMDMKYFDQLVILSWEEKQCRFDSKRPFLMECNGRANIQSPEIKNLTSSTLSVSLEQQTRIDFSFERVKVNLGLDTVGSDYQHYFISFPFNKNNCAAN